jgi:hypothetical protein
MDVREAFTAPDGSLPDRPRVPDGRPGARRIRSSRSRIGQQLAAADRDLEAAKRLHDEITYPLHGRLKEIKEARKDASLARQELYDTCNDFDLQRQLDDADAEIERPHKSSWDLATQAVYLDNKADSELHRADKDLTEADRDHLREQAALFQKQAESMRQRVKASEKAQAEAVKHRDQIEERTRQW